MTPSFPPSTCSYQLFPSSVPNFVYFRPCCRLWRTWNQLRRSSCSIHSWPSDPFWERGSCEERSCRHFPLCPIHCPRHRCLGHHWDCPSRCEGSSRPFMSDTHRHCHSGYTFQLIQFRTQNIEMLNVSTVIISWNQYFICGNGKINWSRLSSVSTLIYYRTVLNTGGKGFEILQKFCQVLDSNRGPSTTNQTSYH